MTRNRQEVTSIYPEIADALKAQQASDFITDGEIVAFDGDRGSFCPAAAAARSPRSEVGAARRGAGVPVCIRRAGRLYHLWSADRGHPLRGQQLLVDPDDGAVGERRGGLRAATPLV